MTKLRSVVESALAGGMSRAERRNTARMMKDELKHIENTRSAIKNSGAGFPIDRALRQLLDCCNDDILTGQAPFPNVWDVFSAFTYTQPSKLINFLKLRAEVDHAFTATDFFAFSTEEELRDRTLPKLRELKEGVIHNYSALDDVRQVTFEQSERDPVVLSGISMIRHNSHLYWMTVGGPVCDLASVTAVRRAALALDADKVRAANPHAPAAQIENMLKPYAVPLHGTDDVWFSFAMGMFNLETAAHEIRILGRDWGVSLAVFSDQFEQKYAESYEKDEKVRRMVDKSVAEVEANGLFFEIAETAFALPAYFEAKVSLVVEETRETELSPSRRNPAARFAMKAPADLRPLTRRVVTLDFGRNSEKLPHSYTPPRFRVEVDGFWRRLPAESIGKDANGQPIRGKTWVRGHARWKDRPPAVGVVLVKTPIRDSLERARSITEKKGGEFSLRISG